jgi:hypothetical protein
MEADFPLDYHKVVTAVEMMEVMEGVHTSGKSGVKVSQHWKAKGQLVVLFTGCALIAFKQFKRKWDSSSFHFDRH